MTPLETLAKYGLKTDVKSIRERLYNPDNYFRELKITFSNTIDGTIKAMNAEDIVHDADLSLLCSLAEKGERWERAVKDIRPVLGKMLEELWRGVEVIPKSFFDKLREYMLNIDNIISEAEGETKCSPRSK
jgi:hypothetical protein